MDYDTKSTREIFKNFELKNSMDPNGVILRESRDSSEHPNSLAIGIALDVTGSMERVPDNIVRDGLPHIMDKIMQRGIADPQMLFMGIGDHTCDSAPFQVGQFESSDELLRKWLTDIYLEGNGGGNDGESYLLAWYFTGYRTALDCLEKRQQKGFLFTIGDEPNLPGVDSNDMRRMFGGQHDDHYSAQQLLQKAQEKYHVYHIHIMETARGRRTDLTGWRNALGENLITVQSYSEISEAIAGIVTRNAMVETQEPVDQNTRIDQETNPHHSYTPPPVGM